MDNPTEQTHPNKNRRAPIRAGLDRRNRQAIWNHEIICQKVQYRDWKERCPLSAGSIQAKKAGYAAG